MTSTAEKAIDARTVRRTLPDELIGHLRDMICSGQLRAGSRISVARLCRRFGVSRTPLREALKVLAVEGLILLSPNRSAIVAPPSWERVDELIPILSALEVLAGETACAVIDDDALKKLQSLHRRCVDCFESGDVSSYMDADTAMRNSILEIAANRKLIDLHQLLHAQLRLPLRAGTNLPGWKMAVEEQKQILLALETKNADMCSAVTRRYMRHRVEILRALIEASAEAGGRRRQV